MTVKFLGQQEIPVGELKAHKENPNRGDINSIAESLEQFGQYRSVVALEDGTILAGHHVVQAAKNIGMATVRVDVVQADEKEARKILLADNRLADLGEGMNLELLLKNLELLDEDLAGTGFDLDYIDALEKALDQTEDDGIGFDEDDDPDDSSNMYCKVSLMVEKTLADRWARVRKLFDDDTTALASLMGDE